MSKNKNEENQAPNNVDKDDEKLLEELEDSKKTQTEDGGQEESPDPKESENDSKKDSESEDEEDSKDDSNVDESEDDSEDEDDDEGRTPRTIELYKHRIAEKKWKKKLEELEAKNKKLEEKVNDKNSKKEADEAIEKEIEKFAKDNDMKPEAVKGILKLNQKLQGGSKVDKDLKKEIEQIKKEKLIEKQDVKFDGEFNEKIAPLLDEQGIKIGSDKYKDIKKSLHEKAFTKKYAKTPLDVIYRGDTFFDRFRGSETKNKKGFEGNSRSTRGAGDVSSKKPTEMEGEEFDEFEKKLERESKEQGIEIQRGGKTIVEKRG